MRKRCEAYGGYEVLGARDSHLDVFGGVRYYNLEIGLGLREGALPGVLLTKDSNWADGVVGVRWDTRFAKRSPVRTSAAAART